MFSTETEMVSDDESFFVVQVNDSNGFHFPGRRHFHIFFAKKKKKSGYKRWSAVFCCLAQVEMHFSMKNVSLHQQRKLKL